MLALRNYTIRQKTREEPTNGLNEVRLIAERILLAVNLSRRDKIRYVERADLDQVFFTQSYFNRFVVAKTTTEISFYLSF